MYTSAHLVCCIKNIRATLFFQKQLPQRIFCVRKAKRKKGAYFQFFIFFCAEHLGKKHNRTFSSSFFCPINYTCLQTNTDGPNCLHKYVYRKHISLSEFELRSLKVYIAHVLLHKKKTQRKKCSIFLLQENFLFQDDALSETKGRSRVEVNTKCRHFFCTHTKL